MPNCSLHNILYVCMPLYVCYSLYGPNLPFTLEAIVLIYDRNCSRGVHIVRCHIAKLTCRIKHGSGDGRQHELNTIKKQQHCICSGF